MKYTITSGLRHLTLGLCLVASVAACKQEPPRNFDQSATERLDASAREVLQLLKGAEHGWVMDYYPQARRSFGGFFMAMKFGDKNLVQTIAENPTGDPSMVTNKWTYSNFHIKQDKGITISFDTYGLPIHVYSDPDLKEGDGEGKGFDGDYEFTISRPVSQDTIYVRGRKNGTEMRLVRAKEDPTETLKKIQQIKASSYTPQTLYEQHLHGLEGTIGGKKVLIYLSNAGYNVMDIYSQEEDSKDEKTTMPYVTTPTGIKFYRAVNGIDELTWDHSAKSYTSSAGDKITARPDPDYAGFAKYLGDYSLQCYTYNNGQKVAFFSQPLKVTFSQAARNVYNITGINDGLVLKANYDAAHQRFEIVSQKISHNNHTVYLCAWSMANNGSLSWTEGYGMYSAPNPDDASGKSFIMKNNGVWSIPCDSYIIWWPNNGEYTSKKGGFNITRLSYPVFTKL